MPRLDRPGVTRMVGAVASDSPGMRRMRIVRGRQGGSADGMKDGGRQVALRWLGEVPMGCRSSTRVLLMDQEVRGTPGRHRPARWCAGGHPSPNQSWLAKTHRWDAAERPGGLGEHGTNTGLLGGEQVAIYFPDSVLGRQGHRLGRTGRTGYSQCPHASRRCRWDATNERENRAVNRPARWRRRWPFTSGSPWVSESIEDSRARTQRSLARGGVLRRDHGPDASSI